MTLQAIGQGIAWPWMMFKDYRLDGVPAFASAQINAAGEMFAIIGHVYFLAGPGTAKTFSSAGGGIQWRTGSTTWANSASRIRVGVQDVHTTAGPVGQPTETWDANDPYSELVQGTDTLTANTWRTDLMEAGTRTLTHGDLIAIVWDMTVLGGADSGTISGIATATTAYNLPVVGLKTSGAWAASGQIPNAIIQCDDGTLCVIRGTLPASALTTRTFANNTATADEYGNVLTPAFKSDIDGLFAIIDPDGDFELKFYSTPTGTPTEEQEIAVDLNITSAAAGGAMVVACGAESMAAATAYAVTVRPSTTTAVTMTEVVVNAAAHLGFWPGGEGCYKCTRLDDTGNFTLTTTARMLCGVMISKLDDGAGGAGGMIVHPGMSGGIRA